MTGEVEVDVAGEEEVRGEVDSADTRDGGEGASVDGRLTPEESATHRVE